MQEHPVPQNITGFEFKLVGFLTLRQFLYLAGAGIIDFVLFVATSAFWKWLFIIPVALLGLAAAFLPIGGIPFDKWVLLLLRALTSPSRRIWFKEPKVISFLAPEFSYYLHRSFGAKPKPTGQRLRLQTFLAQTRVPGRADQLDLFAPDKLLNFGFGPSSSPQVGYPPPPAPAPPEPSNLEPPRPPHLAEGTIPTNRGALGEQERPLRRGVG